MLIKALNIAGLIAAAILFALVLSFDDVVTDNTHGSRQAKPVTLHAKENSIIKTNALASLAPLQRQAINAHWFDPELNRLTILFDPHLTENPTDSNCIFMGLIMHKLASEGVEVFVLPDETGFVPSRVNPMTLDWTRILIQ